MRYPNLYPRLGPFLSVRSSPCRQTSSKAILRQEAETAWLQMQEQYGLPAHIFRLGGEEGRGRLRGRRRAE